MTGRIEPSALPPEDAVALMRRKVPVGTLGWETLFQRDHAYWFTVAQSAGYDVAGDIQKSLADTLERGETFEDWKKNIVPTLIRKGWYSDDGSAVHPVTQKPLGTPRRLRIIYDTNMRALRNAERWSRVEREKKLLPFIRYVAVLDKRTRPAHAAWHGIILPVDHPCWETHRPPNGWNCRCTWQQLTRYDVKERGGVTPDAKLPPRGDVSGIDKGFDYKLGSGHDSESAIADMEERLTQLAQDDAIAQTRLGDYIRRTADLYQGIVPDDSQTQATMRESIKTKALDYFLNPDHRSPDPKGSHGQDKARLFKSVLGIDPSMVDLLAQQIIFSPVSATREVTRYGMKWTKTVLVTGPDGQVAPVIVTWMVDFQAATDPATGVPRLISANIDKRALKRYERSE